MAGLEVIILCMSVITAVLGSHMQGGSMTFRAREKYSNGWVVDLKYMTAFTSSSYRFSWGCASGNCGSELQNKITDMENRTSYPSLWYQNEGYMKRRVTIDKPFQLKESSCCWVYNVNYEGGWELTTTVDLGTRSDTMKPNTSPVTTIIPILRIPRNCATSIKLLAHDPDGDHVTCRYGYYYGECGMCNHYFYLDQRYCSIYFPSGLRTGSYVMEMVLEDFPSKNIYLTYYDRTVSHKYSPFNRQAREAPKESEKYWYWDYTSEGPETTSSYDNYYETTRSSDFVTDVSTDFEQLTTTMESTVKITEATTAEHTYSAPHFYPTESSADPPTAVEETTVHFYPTETSADLSTTVEETTILFYPTGTSVDLSTTIMEETTVHFYPTETSADLSTTMEETTVHFYPTDMNTDQFTSNDATTTPYFYTTDAVTEVPLQTTEVSFQETTFQVTTETVTFPYETTALDISPSFQPPIYGNPLSKIPLQFLIEATSPAPTCAFGEYRPRFLSPTPTHGSKLLANANKKFQLHLTAHAAYERIEDFKVSGLPGMTKSFTSSSQSNTRTMVVEWTPKDDNIGEHVPVCFVAETTNGYQSELRCVVIAVGPSKLVDTVLLCHDNTMTLIIAKNADHQINGLQFRLNDPKCLVSSNSTHLIASVAYNSCGTMITETEEYIIFNNTASSYDTSVVITRQNGVSIPFNCSFPKKNRVSAAFRAHRSNYVFTEAGFGNFTYKFQFFTDNRFAVVNTQSPLQVILKELLYMEIQVSSSVPNVQLFVESCRATPHDNPSDPVFYDIIQNGCIKDNTVVVYPGSRTQYRFAMEAFAFIGSFEEVYINCVVILCKLGASNTRCTKGCISRSMEDSGKHRHRRSIISESQQHFISQGPVTMKSANPADKGVEKTSVLNGNTVVIALSGMATVALISVTLNIYMKRTRAAGYQRLQNF